MKNMREFLMFISFWFIIERKYKINNGTNGDRAKWLIIIIRFKANKLSEDEKLFFSLKSSNGNYVEHSETMKFKKKGFSSFYETKDITQESFSMHTISLIRTYRDKMKCIIFHLESFLCSIEK